MEHSITYFDPFPVLDSAPTTTTISTQHAHDAPLVEMPEAAAVAVAPIAMEEERFSVEYEGPLYTEINIPLPRVPTKYAKNTTAPSKPSAAAGTATTSNLAPQEQEKSSHSRSRTLSSLSAFRNRRFSSSSSTSSSSTVTSPTSPKSSGRHSEDWPRVRRDVVKSREVNAMMDLKHQGKKRSRNGTIDALAVVPAVLVLSAELFTPGENGAGKRKDSGVGRWEDGIR